jgi:group I intron endonuclease
MFSKQPGVYCFKNTVNNKVYIGSAQCLNARINKHLKARDSNPHLQNAIGHYGIDSFCITYQVLETKEEALCLEQMLLDYIFKLNISCYNIANKVSGGCVGTKENHRKLCSKGNGSKAKVRYSLEVNNPEIIYTFKSSYEAEAFTKVLNKYISTACKTASPCNSELGRWLFSDVSKADLINKFNNLTKAQIKGAGNKKFILINNKTQQESQIFNSVYEPLKQGLKVNPSNLSMCLMGKLKTVNGYRVSLVI